MLIKPCHLSLSKSQCPRCSQFVCRDSQSMINHRKICGDSLNCRDCYLIFLTRQELIDHKGICNNRRLKSNSFDNEYQIDDHLNFIDFICTENGCNKIFKSQKTLRQHIKRHRKPYQCNYNGCTKSFGSSWDRKIHGMLICLHYLFAAGLFFFPEISEIFYAKSMELIHNQCFLMI